MADQPKSRSTMGPSTLDLFILTFNCAKNLINVPVFAAHLQQALTQNATGLPDLVVFSLQEVAPLSYSFIGSYLLTPYLSRFEEALNIAAVQIEASQPSSPRDDPAAADSPSSPTLPADGAASLTPTSPIAGIARTWSSRRSSPSAARPYQLVRSGNVGMTAILLFSRQPAAIRSVEVAETGFGVADLGNKGAVGLRVRYASSSGGDNNNNNNNGGKGGDGDGDGDGSGGDRTTELTFVATHLAPMEWNLDRRNANWRSIASGLTFANPRDVVEGDALGGLAGLGGRPSDSAASAARTPEERDRDEGEWQWLLEGHQAASLEAHHRDALRDISVFRPGGYLFVSGDLNYRIASRTPPALAPFPEVHEGAKLHWSGFLERDQLTRERLAGRTFHGMSEADIRFPPTYKFVVLPGPDGAVNEAAARDSVDVVPWKWAPHRWPSWCDRVLFLGVPAWVQRSGPAAAVRVNAYDSAPVMRSSDHQPVFLRADVPLLTRDEMMLPPSSDGDATETSSAWEDDPRVKLPVPIDIDAWERRAAAKKREVMVGWSMFLWSTREGAILIGSLVLVGVFSWWAYQNFW